MSHRTDVLIVGAGPTGLVLALWLARQGVTPRIIDKQEATPSTSRALAIHARTFELYRQLDLAEEVIAHGHKVEAMNFWTNGKHRVTIPIGDIGTGLTPYPFIHIYPQDQHELLLEERLKAMGIRVERDRELVDFTQHEDHVVARLKDTSASNNNNDNSDQFEPCEAAFILGCDGAHSAVRRACEIDFEGATYSQLFFVADVEGTGLTVNGQGHGSFDGPEILLTLAYDNDKKVRLVGAVIEEAIKKDLSQLTLNDVIPKSIKDLDLQIEKVNWFTTYKVHHRVAQTFSKGRAFLVGDAAHIHSPVGGQGMNTGIGDAINLAWKIAAVVQGKADLSLLDTYDVERHAFATTLVHTTDTAFNIITANDYRSYFFKNWIIPVVIPYLIKFQAFQHRLFKGISQTLINYRHSVLSTGTAGYVQGGDRVPWAPVDDVDNFESLRAITWQVHVYGAVKEDMTKWCQSNGIPLHDFPWNEKYRSVGLAKDAGYLIRPDTYIAVAEASGRPEPFNKYLEDNKLRLT